MSVTPPAPGRRDGACSGGLPRGDDLRQDAERRPPRRRPIVEHGQHLIADLAVVP